MESSGETPQKAAVDGQKLYVTETNPRKLPQLRVVESIPCCLSPGQLQTIKGKNKALWLNEGRLCAGGGIGRRSGLDYKNLK